MICFPWRKKAKQTSVVEPVTKKPPFEGMNVWQYESSDVFNFHDIKHWMANYTIEQLFEAMLDENITQLGEYIRIARDVTRHGVLPYLVFPDGKAVELYDENFGNYDQSDPNVIEYMTVPVYATSEEKVYEVDEDFLWDVRWKASLGPVETLSLGGETNFYQGHGWWPHGEVTHKETRAKHWEPLCFIGEVNINGSCGYMFSEHNLDPFEYGVDPTEPFTSYEKLFVLVVSSDPVLPEWIKPMSLHDNATGVYMNPEYASHIRTRIVPRDYFPKITKGCQGNYLLPAPFNHFVYQIPALWNGFVKTGENEYKIAKTDSGTYTISHNNKGEFRASYQQT